MLVYVLSTGLHKVEQFQYLVAASVAVVASAALMFTVMVGAQGSAVQRIIHERLEAHELEAEEEARAEHAAEEEAEQARAKALAAATAAAA